LQEAYCGSLTGEFYLPEESISIALVNNQFYTNQFKPTDQFGFIDYQFVPMLFLIMVQGAAQQAGRTARPGLYFLMRGHVGCTGGCCFAK
jgi:hypothetical protein